MAGTKKSIVVRRANDKKSQPVAKPEPSFFEKLKGQKVVIQSRAGTRYEGLFEAYKDGFFWLREALIIGNTFQAQTALLAIDRGQTAHLHLEPTGVQHKEE